MVLSLYGASFPIAAYVVVVTRPDTYVDENVGKISSRVLWHVQGRAKNLVKFSDACSIRAYGLCIGGPRLLGGRKAGNSNKQEFFCTML